jgi:hypothetical protein
MQRFAVAVLLATLIAFTPAARAVAGIADSPLPVIQVGATTLHLYSVPGVVDNNGIATAFSCTSTDTVAQTVGVEVFGNSGGAPVNNATTTATSVAAGATVVFVTSSTTGLSFDANMNVPTVSRGSARILSTSKKLACTVAALDALSAPPTTTWQLTIIAKTKQKAAN